MQLTILLFFVGFALGVSFLCSLLEAALLSSRNAALSEKKRAGSRGAGFLLEFRQTRIDDAISAILTINTVSNTLGATMAGAQATRVFGDPWVGVFSGVLTLLILVFSEIIPKTLGAIYAANLAGFVGWTLHVLTRLMAPVLFLSRWVTRALKGESKIRWSRAELASVIDTATRDGAISVHESKIIANLLAFREIRVGDVMTPRTVVFMLPCTATVDSLISDPQAQVFSRIPIYRREPDNVVGYVLQRDVLHAVAQGADRTTQLERFVRPIDFIPEMAGVGVALREILDRREPIAMVADEHGGVEGLVTLEDLTETILGAEIVDELDRIADLREAALRLRDTRLERMRQLRKVETKAGRGE